MSKVFNMCGGGGGSSNILWANSIEGASVSNTQTDMTNGTSSGFAWLIPLTMTSGANSFQYSYLRVGPLDLTGISTINAGMSIDIANGTISVVTFASKSSSARSWNSSSISNIVSSWSGNVRIVGSELDVSELSGEYYIYTGIDSQNVVHAGTSTVTIYSLVAR